MKLAIDCRMTNSGGVGSYLNALLPYLTKKNECLLLGNKNELEKFNSERTEILSLETKTFSLKELFAFPKEILKKINKCDIYYSPYFNVPGRITGGIKIPVFTTIHDVVFLDVPGLTSKSGTIIRKFFYKYAVFKSKKIFTVSEFSKERIIHHLKCKKPVVVTYNAVPVWFYEKNSETTETKKENSILFVGNIKKHKGLSVLVDAFKIAKEKGFDLTLKIVGNSENFRTADENIFKKISEAPKNSILFTGRISDEELKNLYRKTKRLVQPSFYEGFGMPPLEAMSLGTKAIISDIPVFKEIYKDFPVTFFKAGDCNDLAEKLLSIKNETDEIKEFPQIYSFEKTAEIIQKTLEESL